jgi:hypothetical protein
LIVLGALAVGALARTVLAFELDALTIALLSGLLFWTQWTARRRARAIAEKVESLVLRHRYGPLSSETSKSSRRCTPSAAGSRPARPRSGIALSGARRPALEAGPRQTKYPPSPHQCGALGKEQIRRHTVRLATTDHLIHAQGLSAALARGVRPAVGFSSPDDVVKDPHLPLSQKRKILSSWASDASAVQDEPTLRWLLGTPEPVPFVDVRDALLRLDRRSRVDRAT